MASNVTETSSSSTATSVDYNLTSSSTVPTTSATPTLPTTQQNNSTIMTYPSEKNTPETGNNGNVIGLSIGLTALALIVLVIAFIAWRRKQQKKKEKPRETMPTVSEVDRVIEDSKKRKKKKHKKGSKHENLAFENEITSSTTQSSPDYENVKNKKEPHYANTDTRVETDQPEYMEPLPDERQMYTSADGGAEYYIEKRTPVPTQRTTKIHKKQAEIEPEDYEVVETSNKKTAPNKSVTTKSDGLGQSAKDYVNVAGIKKPPAKDFSASRTVYQNAS